MARRELLMRVSTGALFLLAAVLVFALARPAPAAHPQGPILSTADVSIQLPGRRFDVSPPAGTSSPASPSARTYSQYAATIAAARMWAGDGSFKLRPNEAATHRGLSLAPQRSPLSHDNLTPPASSSQMLS